MSDTNTGNQIIAFEYKHNTDDMNYLLHDILQPGIYKGGSLSSISGIISIENFSALINTSNTKSVTVQTSEEVVFTEAIVESTPYICASYSQNSQDDYLDFAYTAESSGIVENSICFGKANFSGSAVIDFDYSDKSLTIRNLDDDIIRATAIKSENLNVYSGIIGNVSNSGLITLYRKTPTELNEIATTGYLYDNIPYNKLNSKFIEANTVLTTGECKNNFYFCSNINSSGTITLPTVEESLIVYIININETYGVTLSSSENINYTKIDGTIESSTSVVLDVYEYIKIIGIDDSTWIAEFPYKS